MGIPVSYTHLDVYKRQDVARAIKHYKIDVEKVNPVGV